MVTVKAEVFPRRCTATLIVISLAALLPLSALGATRLAAPEPFNVLYLNGAVVGYPDDSMGGYPLRTLGQPVFGGDSVSKWSVPQVSQGIQWPVLEFSFGGGMAAAWYQWLASEFGATEPSTLTLQRLSGTQVASQVSGSAQLTGLDFPALDRSVVGTSFIKARVALTGQPQVAFSPPGLVPPLNRPPPARQISTQFFRLSLQSLEAATQQAVSVSAITVSRELSSGSGQFSTSKFVVRVPQSAAAALDQWYMGSVLNGTNLQRRAGLLEYTDKTGAVVGSLGLVNVGLLGLTPVSDKGVPLVEITLFCDQVIPQLSALAAP